VKCGSSSRCRCRRIIRCRRPIIRGPRSLPPRPPAPPQSAQAPYSPPPGYPAYPQQPQYPPQAQYPQQQAPYPAPNAPRAAQYPPPAGQPAPYPAQAQNPAPPQRPVYQPYPQQPQYPQQAQYPQYPQAGAPANKGPRPVGVTAQQQMARANAGAPGTQGDMYARWGVSRYKADGTKKTDAELRQDARKAYIAKKKSEDSDWGTAGNLWEAIFGD